MADPDTELVQLEEVSRLKLIVKVEDAPQLPKKVALPLSEHLQELLVEKLRQGEKVIESSLQPVMADPETELVQLEEVCLPSPEPVAAFHWPMLQPMEEMVSPPQLPHVLKSRMMVEVDDAPQLPEKVVLPLLKLLQELPVKKLRQVGEVTESSPQPVIADLETEVVHLEEVPWSRVKQMLVQLEEECLPSPEPVAAFHWPELEPIEEVALLSPQHLQSLVKEEAAQIE
ncbi:magnetosome-associated protein MamJ-like [Saccostrea cucullata]|uniref:magnetosome-associated protein MamJ-like n=1 Tax=Saccostrea cuccullata TaxID=36930 RepID=UPI002ED3938C